MAEHAGTDNVHTRAIADFVSTLGYERIPHEVRERIKLLILDSLGCAIYGAALEWSRILQASLAAIDATRTTSVWGTRLALSSPHAARIDLSRKVEVVHDPAITAQGSAYRHKVSVDVHLRDGTVESETREAPRGSEQSFASEAEIVRKFRKLARQVISDRRQDALIEAVLGMEKLADGKQLAELLRAE
jgi:2-methylcitrate dehydratase PrpD